MYYTSASGSSFEIFKHDGKENGIRDENENVLPAGWYWWACNPGCLPDSEPFGPFKSVTQAKFDIEGDF
jgi:hypothetical protein